MPGDDFNGVFYIKSGRTRHYMANDDGLEKVLYTLTDGWLFGEMAFYLGRKTAFTRRLRPTPSSTRYPQKSAGPCSTKARCSGTLS